jgi:hypothetical protein
MIKEISGKECSERKFLSIAKNSPSKNLPVMNLMMKNFPIPKSSQISMSEELSVFAFFKNYPMRKKYLSKNYSAKNFPKKNVTTNKSSAKQSRDPS